MEEERADAYLAQDGDAAHRLGLLEASAHGEEVGGDVDERVERLGGRRVGLQHVHRALLLLVHRDGDAHEGAEETVEREELARVVGVQDDRVRAHERRGDDRALENRRVRHQERGGLRR